MTLMVQKKPKGIHYWLTTNVKYFRNTYVEYSEIMTNGHKVESDHPKERECFYNEGFCKIPNKVIAWKHPCFYNLQFAHSEICHH